MRRTVRTFTKEEMIERVSAAIRSCPATLITVDREGTPHARVLEDHNPYPGFEFWLATHARTRKVGEIEAHPQVCLHYRPSGMVGYISLLGVARVRRDEEARRYIWREEWVPYYGDPMSPEYVPIQVIPWRIEFYDANLGAHAEDGFGPVVVDL